jgi:hypothetical protein
VTATPRECWRYVRRDRRYKVSSLGAVRSLPRVLSDGRSHGGCLLTPVPDKDGYLRVCIGGQMVPVHHLVMDAFIGPCPDGMERLHGLGGQQDNSAANLRYGSHAENERDKREFAAARATAEGRIRPEAERPPWVVTPVTGGAAGG